MKVLPKLDIDHHYHHQFYGYLALHKSNGFPRNIAKPSSLLWENTESTLLQNETRYANLSKRRPKCNQYLQRHTYFVKRFILEMLEIE